MGTLWIILIAVAFVALLGPVMLLAARLNKVDPYVLEKLDGDFDQRSYILVSALKPLFWPLWVERRIVRAVARLLGKGRE